MKYAKKSLLVVLSGLMCLALIAACGSKSTPTPAAPVAEATEAPKVTEAT